MPSVPTLAKIAVGIWFSGVGAYVALTEKLQYNFRHATFVKEAMRVFDGYPHTEQLLGTDVKQLRFDLGDDFNKKNDHYAQIVIPVVGSKQKGKIYSWSSLQPDEKNNTERWRVDRLDLMIHRQKPFTFYRHPDADYVKHIELKEYQLVRHR